MSADQLIATKAAFGLDDVVVDLVLWVASFAVRK